MALNVVNLLATSRFAEYIDLDHFSIETGLDFDPDRFPGMTYKIENPKVCALIFRSGRIVITGAKKIEDVESALIESSLIFRGTVIVRSILFLIFYLFFVHNNLSIITLLPIFAVIIFLFLVLKISFRENIDELNNSLENISSIDVLSSFDSR